MDYATPEDPLIQELCFYEENKRGWLNAHAEKFVVISRDCVEGFHPDCESAFKAGLKAFGLDRQFLIRQICEAEPMYAVYLWQRRRESL